LISDFVKDEQDACSTVEEQRFSAATKGERVEQAFQARVKAAPRIAGSRRILTCFLAQLTRIEYDQSSSKEVIRSRVRWLSTYPM
jgi:hypothetical protein